MTSVVDWLLDSDPSIRWQTMQDLLDAPPELTHAVGTNYALIHAAASEDGKELQVMVAMDNLVKGAGGQAIQAMNLALGIAEEAGLRGGGMFPC